VQQFLKGVPYKVQVSTFEENLNKSEFDGFPEKYTMKTAEMKARDVAQLVIACLLG
jgi:predicted house-cleaning NTP pyrophosphatase (Maf/HAM1 superfamily)